MWMDGYRLLEAVLQTSDFGSPEQAVASLTKFTHPDTVKQTQNLSVFRVIRCKAASERGSFRNWADGVRVMLDDNTAPTDTFLWANNLSRSYRDVQFNHIYPSIALTHDVCGGYTSLANLCVTPSFVAKLTDTNQAVCALLRYRVFELYGFSASADRPEKPHAYDLLRWADPLPIVPDVERRFRQAMQTKSKNRTVSSAREIGWLFSDNKPDPTV